MDIKVIVEKSCYFRVLNIHWFFTTFQISNIITVYTFWYWLTKFVKICQVLRVLLYHAKPSNSYIVRLGRKIQLIECSIILFQTDKTVSIFFFPYCLNLS